MAVPNFHDKTAVAAVAGIPFHIGRQNAFQVHFHRFNGQIFYGSSGLSGSSAVSIANCS